VSLRPSSGVLDEFIVTGYQTQSTNRTWQHTIASVKSEDIEELVALWVLVRRCRDKLPGYRITQTTGAPGDDIAVRIRGVGTLNDR
jgi:CHAD domain-containing protein